MKQSTWLMRLAVGVAGLALALAFQPACASAPVGVRKSVAVDWNPVLSGGYRGVWNTGPGMALVSHFPVAKDAPFVFLEAENASAVLVHEKGGLRKEVDAFGGAFVSQPKTIEFFLALEQPGACSVWYRVRLVGAAREARHLEGVDASLGGSVGWVSLKRTQEGWQWLKGDIRHSFKRKGILELQMDQMPEGLELDAIVLASDEHWTPDRIGQGVAAAPATPWTNANLETADLCFAEVTSWGVVRCPIDVRDGKAAFHYSVDSGKTWSVVPGNGDLSSLPVRSDGRDRVRFRIQLSRQAGGVGPLVSPSLELSYSTLADSLISVEDELSRYHFSRKNGALCGIENKKTGSPIVPVGIPAPVFSLQMKKPGFLTGDQEKTVVPAGDAPDGHDVLKAERPVSNKLETVTSLDAECLGVRVDENPGDGFYRALLAEYVVTRQDGTVKVGVTVKFRARGESHWAVHVVNQLKELEICEVGYPILDRIRTGEKPSDESLLLFGNYLVGKPSSWGHFQYWWPGVSYPMLDVSSAQQGISLIAHDLSLRSTCLSAQGQNKETTRLALLKAVCVRPGQVYPGPDHIVRVHEGSWENACFLEKDWAQKKFPLADTPLWAQELDLFSTSGWPVPRWDHWRDSYGNGTAAAPPGQGLLGLWAYQVPGTHWSMPHPNPIFGDEEDLRWAVRDFRRNGRRFIMYFQSLLWDESVEGPGKPDDRIGYLRREHLWPGWELPLNGFAQSNGIRDIYGKPHVYSPENIAGRYFNTPMDQASPGFRDYKYRWAVDLFGKRLGLDGIYWDSDSGYFGSPSWRGWQEKDFDPGMQGRGAVANALRIRRAYQEMRPDAVFVGEGTSSVAMHQARDFTLQNLYSVYPMKIMFPQMRMMAEGKDYDRAFLAGLCFIARFEEVGSVSGVKLQRYLAMRRRVGQYLHAGEFRNERGIAIQGAGVEAKLFCLNDGRNQGVLLNILNPKKEPDATIEVDAAEIGDVAFGWIVRDDGTEGAFAVPAPFAPFRYRVPVPAAEAAHILLLKRAEPRVVVSAGKPLLAGGQAPVELSVSSLTDRQTGTLGLDLPERLRSFISADTVDFEVGPGETRDYALMVRAAVDSPADLVTLPVRVRPAASSPFLRQVSLYLHEPLDVQLEMVGPDTLRIRLQNGVDAKSEVALALSAVKGTVALRDGDLNLSFALKANETKEVVVSTKGAAEAQQPWALRGTVACRYAGAAGRTEPLYKRFWPIIANGSLELCEFRKGAPEKEYYQYAKSPDKMTVFPQYLPDYWWGLYSDKSPLIDFPVRFYAESKPFEPDWAMDESEAGNRSLRLKPDSRVRIQDNHGRYAPIFIEKGRQYRFQVRMKQVYGYGTQRSSAVLVGHQDHMGFAALSLEPGRHESGRWYLLETAFIAPTDRAALHLCSGQNTTVWFDDFSIVPLHEEGTGK